LPASGFEGNNFSFFKLEKESAGRKIITMMLFIIWHRKIPDIWKMEKQYLSIKQEMLTTREIGGTSL
jgi:hypothetical protein